MTELSKLPHIKQLLPTTKMTQLLTYDSRKNKTNPFVYNKNHPKNDKTKNPYLENTNKNYYSLRNAYKNHFLEKTRGRKKRFLKRK